MIQLNTLILTTNSLCSGSVREAQHCLVIEHLLNPVVPAS